MICVPYPQLQWNAMAPSRRQWLTANGLG